MEQLGLRVILLMGFRYYWLLVVKIVACIAESAIGLTRMQVNKKSDLYVALTLAVLIVGTVLPTPKECLEMLKCIGAGDANKFAEICCAIALAGEISIVAAMPANHFSSAHQKLGRK